MRHEEEFSDEGLTDDQCKSHLSPEEPIENILNAKSACLLQHTFLHRSWSTGPNQCFKKIGKRRQRSSHDPGRIPIGPVQDAVVSEDEGLMCIGRYCRMWQVMDGYVQAVESHNSRQSSEFAPEIEGRDVVFL